MPPLFILHEASLKNIQDGKICYSKKFFRRCRVKTTKQQQGGSGRQCNSITHLGLLQQPHRVRQADREGEERLACERQAATQKRPPCPHKKHSLQQSKLGFPSRVIDPPSSSPLYLLNPISQISIPFFPPHLSTSLSLSQCCDLSMDGSQDCSVAGLSA